MPRISCDELADLVVEVLKAVKPAGDTTTYEKFYLQQILDRDYQGSITGRKVYAVPLGKRQAEPASRGDDTWEWEIRVLIVERYTTAGDPPETWTRDQTRWVEDNILHAIGDARKEDEPKRLYDLGFWPEEAEIEEFFDDNLLRVQKLFFSAVMFKFRRDE